MNRCLRASLTLLCLSASLALAAPVSVTPADRNGEAWWKKRHEEKLQLTQQGGWDVVFIGDSITQGWEGPGKQVWQKYYGGRKALNLGYSGDRTEHVLWRFANGEIDGLKPKLAIIMIGTNNTGHRMDPPADIAAGVEAILAVLKEKMPDAKVLLLGIFPRGAKTGDKMRVNNDKTNELIAKFADGSRVTYLNINDQMLEADGTLSKEIMPDLLHPQQRGYGIWAKAIEPAVSKALGGPAIAD